MDELTNESGLIERDAREIADTIDVSGRKRVERGLE